MLVSNCEINLILTLSATCVITNRTGAGTFNAKTKQRQYSRQCKAIAAIEIKIPMHK